jgi:hypothetical protein
MDYSQTNIKKNHIILISWVLLAGFTLSFLVNFIIGSISGAGYPFNTFFFRPEAIALDFDYPYKIAGDPYTQFSDRTNQKGVLEYQYGWPGLLSIRLLACITIRSNSLFTSINNFLVAKFIFLYLYLLPRNIQNRWMFESNPRVDIFLSIALFVESGKY